MPKTAWLPGVVLIACAVACAGSDPVTPTPVTEISCPLSVTATCVPPPDPVDTATPPPCANCAGVSLPGLTMASCTSGTSTDADADSLSDDCEYQIAYAFSPILYFAWDEYDWGREPYWAATRKYVFGSPTMVKVLYLLAYHRDGDFYIHAGDSEFIEVQVHYDAASDRWLLDNATYSAHWHSSNDHTALLFADDLDFDYNYRGRPSAYVAFENHGNYQSVGRCNSIIGDRCDMRLDPNGVTATVLRSRNLGQNAHRLIDCIGSQTPGTYPGIECFWTGSVFRGWYGSLGPGRSTTPYRDVLAWYGY